MLTEKRNDTEKLIVQSSRRSQNQRLMIMILTHLYFHFLSTLQFAVQRNLSEFWIQVLPITLVSKGSGLLVLKKLDGGI